MKKLCLVPVAAIVAAVSASPAKAQWTPVPNSFNAGGTSCTTAYTATPNPPDSHVSSQANTTRTTAQFYWQAGYQPRNIQITHQFTITGSVENVNDTQGWAEAEV